MGIPLVAGRDFSTHDGSGAPIVSVIDETLAKRYFAGQNVLDQRFAAVHVEHASFHVSDEFRRVDRIQQGRRAVRRLG